MDDAKAPEPMAMDLDMDNADELRGALITEMNMAFEGRLLPAELSKVSHMCALVTQYAQTKNTALIDETLIFQIEHNLPHTAILNRLIVDAAVVRMKAGAARA